MQLGGKGAGAGRKVLLEGLSSWGTTKVEDVLRRGAAALGVGSLEEVVMQSEGRLLRGGGTLAEAGMASGDVLVLWIGSMGGMPSTSGGALHVLADAPEALLDKTGRNDGDSELAVALGELLVQLTHEESVIEGAVRRLNALQQGKTRKEPAGTGLQRRGNSPTYGGDYLERIVGQLEKGLKIGTTDANKADMLSRQTDLLLRLKVTLGGRFSEDASLCTAKVEGKGRIGVVFDADVDDDEVLLRLFCDVDKDKNGTISLEELLAAPLLQKAENAEMAKVLQLALGCDLQALQEALESVDKDDLVSYGHLAGGNVHTSDDSETSSTRALDRGAAVSALFDAIKPSGQPAITQGADQATTSGAGQANNSSIAKLADFDRFLTAMETPDQDSALVLPVALKKLSEQLPAELDFLALKEAARKLPRVSAQRPEWVRTLGLDAALARHLPPGTLGDGCALRGRRGGGTLRERGSGIAVGLKRLRVSDDLIEVISPYSLSTPTHWVRLPFY